MNARAERPTLLSACASAATAQEARFRIDGPEPAARTSRIIALDVGAATLLAGIETMPWRAARFLVSEASGAEVGLRDRQGRHVELSAELQHADMVVLVATDDAGAAAATAIGRACQRRGIMTGGIVHGPRDRARAAVAALRPHAQVLLVSDDEEDLAEVLTALRA